MEKKEGLSSRTFDPLLKVTKGNPLTFAEADEKKRRDLRTLNTEERVLLSSPIVTPYGKKTGG